MLAKRNIYENKYKKHKKKNIGGRHFLDCKERVHLLDCHNIELTLPDGMAQKEDPRVMLLSSPLGSFSDNLQTKQAVHASQKLEVYLFIRNLNKELFTEIVSKKHKEKNKKHKP